MNTAEILEAAADLIEPPGAWIQGAMAKNKDGQAVHPASPRAVCWCVNGAIEATAGRDQGGFEQYSAARYAASGYIARTTGQDLRLCQYNDDEDRTQPEVVAALRAAAKEVTNGEA